MSDIEDEINRLIAQGQSLNSASNGAPTGGAPTQGAGGSGYSPTFTAPSAPQMSQQSSGPRRTSRQAAMMNMVQAGQVQTGTATVQTQTDNYQPTAQPQPTQTQEPTNNIQQSTTLINNTVQQGVNNSSGNLEQEGFMSRFKGKALLIGGIAVVLILLLIFLLPKLSGGNEEPVATPEPMEELDWIIPEPVGFKYTQEQVAELRKVGYTGDEIEQFQISEMDCASLVAQAEAERQAWIDEAVAPLYDLASDEYKEYISDSWLSLPERTDMSEYINNVITSERRNLDYEKIKVYGNQLFVKIYLDDSVHEDWFFIQVTPEQWNKLNDFGNIIVTYSYCNKAVYNEATFSYDADRSSFYILSASIEFIE